MLVGLLLGQPVAGAQPVGPPPGGETVTVSTAMEAWYHTIPFPVGDLVVVPPPVDPYEKHTLHVRITAGLENARSYLSLDLTRLPIGADVTEGLLTLPVAPSEEQVDDDRSARLWVCLGGLLDGKASGSFERPPKVDCGTRSGATYVNKPDPHFIVSLVPFGDLLQTKSLAIVPSDVAKERGDTWHVSFYGRKNDSKGAKSITADLVIERGSGMAEVSPPFFSPGEGAGLGSGSPVIGVPAAPPPIPSSTGGSQSTAPGTQPAAALAVAARPSYTAVWALPLLLLLLAGYFRSALTRDFVVPVRRFDERS